MDDEFSLHVEYPTPPQHLLYECLTSGPFTETFLESQKYQNIHLTPWSMGQHHKEQQRSVGYDVPFYSNLGQEQVTFRVSETQKHFLTREKEVIFSSNFSCEKLSSSTPPASSLPPSPFFWVTEWTIKPSSPKESNHARFLGENFSGKLDAKVLSNILSYCTIEGKVKKGFSRGLKGEVVEMMEFATAWTEVYTKGFMKWIEQHFHNKDAYTTLSAKISGNFDYVESNYGSQQLAPNMTIANPTLIPNNTNTTTRNSPAMFEMDDEEDEEDEEVGSLMGGHGRGAGAEQEEEDNNSESSIHSFLANSPHQQSKLHAVQQEMNQLKGLVLSGRGDAQSLTQRIQVIESQLSDLTQALPSSSSSSSSSSPSSSSPSGSPRSNELNSFSVSGDGTGSVQQLQRQITLSRQRDIETQKNTTVSLASCQNDLQKHRYFLVGVAMFALCWPICYSFLARSGPQRVFSFVKSKFNDFFP